jgi:hypothetical protein
MNKKETLLTLMTYNKWRTGAKIPQPNPKDITMGIESAIKMLHHFPEIPTKTHHMTLDNGNITFKNGSMTISDKSGESKIHFTKREVRQILIFVSLLHG